MGGGLRDGALILWVALGGMLAMDLVACLRRRHGIGIDLLPELFVGDTQTMTLRVDRAPQDLAARIDWPAGLDGPADITFTGNGENQSIAHVSVTARRRGQWLIDRLWLRWLSPLRLLEVTPCIRVETPVSIVPSIRRVQSGEITSMVLSALYGVKENRAIGEGSEFHQLRDFVQGMDVRSIDWKRSAKHRSLVAKDMRAERNHHVIVALDNGHLMREQIAGLPKIDHAINAALATAWAATIGGDQVGFYAFDARPRIFVPPERGRLAFAALRSRTAELTYTDVESNHTLAMAELNARTPRRSLIVVFSDFEDTTTAELLVENVGILSKRHVIVFVALRDPHINDLATQAPDGLDDVATLVAASQVQTERQIVMERLSRLGIIVIDSEPRQVTARLISAYLDIKARELI
ncbi:DUF58 domain-containing protein [Actibacterium sp. 188UL27-1]|nr:DUF58 domain-containing protein [Actibacterium sp. 188UL27-1]